jgi:hypothetical protein
MAVTIGGADGGYTKKKTFKIKDGDNVYRILPSLGFNGRAPDGKPFKFYNVHFGYKTKDGKMRVFQSPEVKNRDTKMTEKNDPAKERIEKLKAALETAKEAKDKATVDRIAPLVSGQKPLYNLDNNHHCNAINQNGEIGVLKLRHRAKLALDAVVKQLRGKQVEPLGADNGRYFIINRTGTGLETTFTVTVLKRSVTIDGQEFEQDVVHKLTPEIIARLETEAADLDNLYVRPSTEDVARIVAESELSTGKSPNIDAILKATTAQQVEEADDSGGEEDQPNPAGPEGRPATEAEIAALNAKNSPAPAATQPAPQQTLSQPAPAPTVTVQVQATAPAPKPVAEQTDEEFLKSLGAL